MTLQPIWDAFDAPLPADLVPMVWLLRGFAVLAAVCALTMVSHWLVRKAAGARKPRTYRQVSRKDLDQQGRA